MKKNMLKLNAAVHAMLKRVAPNGLSNDSETIETIKEMEENLATIYDTGRTHIVDTIRVVKDLNQLCMLGDLARQVCLMIDLDEEYARVKDMPEGEDLAERLHYLYKDIAWLHRQIPNYNKPAEELDYEADCEYYEYPTPYGEAIVTLKIHKIASWSWNDGSSIHSEIKITAEYKTYYQEYDIASYDPENYDKKVLIQTVKDGLEKAIEEIEVD